MTVLSTLHQTYWGFTRRSIIQGCDDPGHRIITASVLVASTSMNHGEITYAYFTTTL